MNRRQKIIISVTGIFLVLLILVGLTYAYFLTQIQGNDEDKSITVTTANLVLEYGDGNGILNPANALTPGDKVKFKDANNNVVEAKTFTVTNKGNSKSDYVVVIEDVVITNVSDGTSTTFQSNDFRYTLTCTKNDGTKCNEVKDLSVFPINGGILIGNDSEVGEVHTYSLSMWYIETGKNQTNDMNKTLSAKVNIKDISKVANPYETGNEEVDNANLAYNIINNALTKKYGTSLLNTSVTPVAEQISSYKTGKKVKKTVDFASYEWIYAETFEEIDAGGGEEVTECTDDLIGMWLLENSGGFFDYYGTYIIQVVDCDGDKPMYMAEEMIPEKTLSVTNDDYGTSYYYRGAV